MNAARRTLGLLSRRSPARILRPAPPSARLFSSASSSDEPTPAAPRFIPNEAPPQDGFALLSSRSLISLSGPDAAKFLNGAVTAEIKTNDVNPPVQYAAFLSAQGRVLHDVLIYADGLGIGKGDPATSFLVEVAADEAVYLLKLIKKYKLRAKFDVRLLDHGEVGLWSAWNGDSPLTKKQREALTSFYGNSDSTGVISVTDPRLSQLGSRFITLNSSKSPDEPLGLTAATFEDYTVRRMLQGVAEGQQDIFYDRALPMEANMDVLNGIHYNKGCYVGQELTIRTKHRGVVRKRILPCMLYEPDAPVPTALVYSGAVDLAAEIPGTLPPISRASARRHLGRYIGGMGNVALAVCRLESMTGIAPPGEEPGAPVTFNAWSEFTVNWTEDGMIPYPRGPNGEQVEGMVMGKKQRTMKLRPFVPEWLVKGLEKQKREKETAQQLAKEDEEEGY